ncbi:sigma-E processing peptidase SpoIIGA [Caproiciproducens sp. LBM24188]
MKQTIYVDVLVGVNLFINYFLLLAVSKFLTIPVRRRRILLGALLGSAYSLFILLPDIPVMLSLLVKLIMSATIILASFSFRGFKQFLRQLATFYIISFSFAGLMLAIWYFIAPQGLIIKNSVVYFNISPLLLILLTVVCYLMIRLIHRISGRQAPEQLFYRIRIEYGNQTAACVAKVDTGNSLCEPFSNYPVVVVTNGCAGKMLPSEDSGKIRLVPFHAVSGNGLLPAFKPDRLVILSGKKEYEQKNVYIAVTQARLGEAEALLNPDLLQRTSA